MSELLNAYNDMLTGKKNLPGTYYFRSEQSGGINEKNALSLIRYALEYLMGWDTITSLCKFDWYIIKKLKLEKIIRYISYPVSVAQGDTRYILSLIYPDAIQYPEPEQIKATYMKVLEHDMQFPRGFFSGEKGLWRYQVCLKYVLTHFISFHTLPDIYEFFLKPESSCFLERYRMRGPAVQYEIDLFKVLYQITCQEQNSMLYYCYYEFIHALKSWSHQDPSLKSD